METRAVLLLPLILGCVHGDSINWDELEDRRIRKSEEHDFFMYYRDGDTRIVGGKEATPGQFPYQAGLVLTLSNGKQAFCGGSLISLNYILTAAHCVDGATSADVILGAEYIREKEDSQVRMTSTELIIHERWNSRTLRNDIALIKLPSPVTKTDRIQLIDLPPRSEKSERFTDQLSTISGWGKDKDNATTISPVLRFVETPVISNFWCFFSYPFMITDSHICADGKQGKSSCNGDSGGPMTVQYKSTTIQVGIVSFGKAAGCEKGYPPVFTRVTSYLEWIESHSDVTIRNSLP